MSKPITPTPRYLVLALTDECNLSCCYCYRGEPKKTQPMSLKTIEKSLRFAAASDRRFHVQMTGGEPTLKPEIIEWTASRIRSIGRPATIAVQTNGTLLDRSLVKLFKKYDVQVGISIDGAPSVQKRLRGNAEATIRGIKLLSDANVEFRVTAVVTRDNVEHLRDLALFLAAFQTARGLGLDLLVLKGRAKASKSIGVSSEEALKDGIIRLVGALRLINKKRSIPIQLREWDRIKRLAAVGKTERYCHACNAESLAVLPNGTLFPCGQTAGDPEFACGTVDAPNLSGMMALSGKTLRGDQCGGCPLVAYCPDDCPGRLHYNDTHTRRLACIMYQTLWEVSQKDLQ